jgi:hypothetical protein
MGGHLRIFIPLLLVGLVLAFQNCSNETPSGTKSASAKSALTLFSPSDTVATQQTLMIEASGGTAPYAFSVVVGAGAISPVDESSALFTAPALAQTSTVRVVDANGAYADKMINSTNSLTLSFTPLNPKSTDLIALTGQNGNPPFSFSLVAGPGTLAGSFFTPAATGGITRFEVQDANGNRSGFDIAVAVVTTAIIYRFLDGGGAVHFRDDPNPPAGMTASGSYKLFKVKAQVADPIIVRKCENASSVYFTHYLCVSGYTNLGVVGYASAVELPNTAEIYGTSTNTSTSLSRKPADIPSPREAIGYVPK